MRWLAAVSNHLCPEFGQRLLHWPASTQTQSGTGWFSVAWMSMVVCVTAPDAGTRTCAMVHEKTQHRFGFHGGSWMCMKKTINRIYAHIA
jgi:hypothetical protein